MRANRIIGATTLALTAAAVAAVAGGAEPTFLHFDTPRALLAPAYGSALKPKLLRLSYETPGGGSDAPLVCIVTVATGPDVWTFDGATHAAGDVFALRSVDGGATWSTPVNCSATAALSSMSADHDGDAATPSVAYHGDSGKPVVFAHGRNVLVTWIDRYCPTSTQRSIVYDHGGADIEVPYAALYAARSTDGGATWLPPERLTDGSRDAIQPMPRGNAHGWAIAWQEDPRGLQPGEAEGPGDGGSGAHVTNGTDIWFTSLTAADFADGRPFPPGRRLTDNVAPDGGDEGVDEHADDALGVAGASRPNLALVGPTAIVAYEETKGAGGTDFGKVVRYHVFSAFDDSAPDPTAGAGWIVSDPGENARRVRLVAQSPPGPATGVRMVMLYKQGCYDQGGPSDIIARVARGGVRPEHLWPPVDPGCTTIVGALGNAPGLNVSSAVGLDAATGDDAHEDARAHRAVLRGDFVMIGYSRTPDWAAARFTDLANYDFHVRRSDDGGATWSALRNLSALATTTVSVYEPRLVATPKSDDPAEPRNTNVIVAAWGTERNQYDHLAERTLPLDLMVTRTADRGLTYDPTQVLAGGPALQAASQLRASAPGDRVFAVWMDETASGTIVPMFRSGRVAARLPGDVDLDGHVGLSDLFVVLAHWGACDNCLGDLNANGVVDAGDLAALFGQWGHSAP